MSAGTIFLLIAAVSYCSLLLTSRTATASSELRLEAGQYQRLLVFMEEDSESRPAGDYSGRLENIQTGFQRASDLLESLTSGVGRRWRFGNVSILVSARLGRALSSVGMTVSQRQWQRRDRADFIVSSDVVRDNEGSVAVEAGCGKPGRHVLMSAESFGGDFFRTVDRKIALYFSQYRWGLLSEEPIGDPIQTGASGREMRPAACSLSLPTGLRIRGTNRPCAYSVATRSLSPNCSIVLNESNGQSGHRASFLFAPYSSNLVNRFCESSSMDPAIRHNRGANNLMNQHCNGLGAADVIRLHPDFQATPVGTEPPAGPVTFQVVAEPDARRVVIVMDTSGSMASESRITKMIGAVRQFVVEVLEDGSQCALINFHTQPLVILNFITVETLAARQQLAGAVSSLKADGGTCIGGAVIEAMRLLGANTNRPSKRDTGQVILLSDGIEGCGDLLESAISLISQTSIEVVTIRYGDQADKRMSLLAERSGGRQFFGETSEAAGGLASLRLSLGETTSGLGGAERALTLASEEIGPQFRRRRFNVDASVGRDLAFTLSFPETPQRAANLRLLVRSPSGKEFGFRNGSDVYKVDVATGTVSVNIPVSDNEPGIWTMLNLAGSRRRRQVNSSSQKDVEEADESDGSGGGGGGGLVVVTGRPAKPASGSSKAPTVTTLTAEVVPETVSMVIEETRIVVYARLLNGYSPVLGAVIFATVRSNEGRVGRVNLTDSGAGADLKANDGTYSGYLQPVESLNQARDFSVYVTATKPVSRVASAGKLTVTRRNEGFNRSLEQPARITDLRVAINLTDYAVLLAWTASDNQDTPGYTVRCSRSHEQLLSNFSACEELVSLTAFPDQRRDISANVHSHVAYRGGRLFVAVAGVSAFNVTGSPSNPVVLDDLTRAPSSEELRSIGVVEEAPKAAMPAPSGVSWLLIAGVCVGCLLAAAIAGLLLFLALRARRQRLAGLRNGGGNGGGGQTTEVPLLEKA